MYLSQSVVEWEKGKCSDLRIGALESDLGLISSSALTSFVILDRLLRLCKHQFPYVYFLIKIFKDLKIH